MVRILKSLKGSIAGSQMTQSVEHLTRDSRVPGFKSPPCQISFYDITNSDLETFFKINADVIKISN
jgi:hypothetical protein